MEKYVNVKDVIKTILNKIYYNNLNGDLYSYEVIHAIEEMPAADVREVVHGEWKFLWMREDPDTAHEAQCSNCRKISEVPVGNFCKWCGAYMRGVKT